MTLITKITTQKRNSERFNVFIDRGNGEEFGFSIDQDVLISSGLTKGLEINEEEMGKILYEDEVKKGFNLALRFLSYRMRTVKEIQQHLQKKDYSEDAINEIIKKLNDYGYVNDLEFAKAFVRTRKNTTVKGPELLKKELTEKGIGHATLEEGIQLFTREEQIDSAIAFIEKKSRASGKLSTSALKQKLRQTLYGKGFSWEIIDCALQQVNIDHNEESEWKALEYEGEKAQRKYKKYAGWEFERRIRQYLYGKGFPFELIDEYMSKLHEYKGE